MISSLDVRHSHGVWESWPALLGAREPSGPLADPFLKELRKLNNPRVVTGIVNVYQLECAKLVYSLYISSLNPYKTHRGECYFESRRTDKETEAPGGEAYTASKCQNWNLNLGSLAPIDTFF